MKNSKFHRLSIFTLKYMPVIGALFMWVHVLLLILGISLPIANSLFGIAIIPCLMAIVWSKAFGFCTIHRHFTGYICAVSYCIDWQLGPGFGIALLGARLTMLILGLALFIWFIILKCNGNKSMLCRQ